MARKPSKRDGWHQAGGKWTRSLGSRGTRVRLFEKRKGGTFYREVWLARTGRDLACLHTKNRDEAERLGRALLASLLLGNAEVLPNTRIRLIDLWQRYQRECTTYVDNKLHTKRDSEQRIQVLLGFFGEDCDVRKLSAADQSSYSKARRAGGIRRASGNLTLAVRARSVEADLVLLHALLLWATTVRLSNGSRWLESNPLSGVRRVREASPKRPVATWERYQVTRVAIRLRAAGSAGETGRTRWVKMELALVLAEGTGRRLGSIRQVRWEDVDFSGGTILWRAEADKKGQAWTIPIPDRFADELRSFRRRLGAVGGWVFAAEQNPETPMDRHLFDKWLALAERDAKLPKLDGGLWHPYRRKWATERKHLSLTDVAAAGGWKDTDTLITCYQAPDSKTLLAVMSEERKLHDVVRGA